VHGQTLALSLELWCDAAGARRQEIRGATAFAKMFPKIYTNPIKNLRSASTSYPALPTPSPARPPASHPSATPPPPPPPTMETACDARQPCRLPEPFGESTSPCFQAGGDLDLLSSASSLSGLVAAKEQAARRRVRPHVTSPCRHRGSTESMLHFLERLLLKGDSMNRNQFESMLCVLREPLPDKAKMFEMHGYRISKGQGFFIFEFTVIINQSIVAVCNVAWKLE
jgi:hypothetical protein